MSIPLTGGGVPLERLVDRQFFVVLLGGGSFFGRLGCRCRRRAEQAVAATATATDQQPPESQSCEAASGRSGFTNFFCNH